MLKKMLWPLLCIACVVMLQTPAFASEEKSMTVGKKYTALFGKNQGKNNWYFCEFGKNSSYELKWDEQAGRWLSLSGQGTIGAENIGIDSVMGIGYKFVAPTGGVVRIRGSVEMPYESSASGDGCVISIYHNGKKETEQFVVYGTKTEYDFNITVDIGDEICFVANCSDDYNNDWIKWIPTVEYIDVAYSGESEYIYYQKQGVSRQTLSYDNEEGGYVNSDKSAIINSNKIKSGNEVILGKRYMVPEGGRYRIHGYFSPDGNDGETVVTVLKNGGVIWRQMFPGGERANIDVRAFVKKNDKIDVEITTTGCVGDKQVEYRCEITKYIGTMFCDGDTSYGDNYRIVNEYSISDFIEEHQVENRVEFYSIKNDVKYNMNYSNSLGRWISNIPDSNGYVSYTKAFSGYDTDSGMELILKSSGILKIDGKIRVCDFGDGVTSKIYLNDKLLWSSRVGGERPVRWDEPYDVSYFLNKINVVAEVKEGDKLTFEFDQWRKANYDEVDFSEIKIRYIGGEILSETTKWKLKQSIAVDVQTEEVYVDGTADKADLFIENETVYISKEDSVKITGKESKRSGIVIDGKEYLPIRDILEDENKNVLWTADRLVVAYDGIDVLFGYSEISEIETVLMSDDVDEYAELEIVNKNGEEINEITNDESYHIKSLIENYIGKDIKIKYIIAYYNADKALYKIDMSDEILVGTGETFDTESMTEKILPDIVTDKNTAEIKVFIWYADKSIKPYVSAFAASK